METKLQEMIQMQFNRELFNERVYTQMANLFGFWQLYGFQKFCFDQADGEREHSRILSKLLTDKRILPKVIKPEGEKINYDIKWSVDDALAAIVDLELGTTSNLKYIFNASMEDGQVNSVIQDMLKEQLEEERTSNDMLNQVVNGKDVVILIDRALRS